jgi:hypothetical protein
LVSAQETTTTSPSSTEKIESNSQAPLDDQAASSENEMQNVVKKISDLAKQIIVLMGGIKFIIKKNSFPLIIL